MTTLKPYLNPNLDLQTLSELSNMNSKVTSRIINHDLNTNFYEFVNKYRIEEFKQWLQQEDRDKFTLLTHAQESGFNSKSTFNHVFKKLQDKRRENITGNLKISPNGSSRTMGKLIYLSCVRKIIGREKESKNYITMYVKFCPNFI